MNAPMVVWRLTDGRPGHDSQTMGLVSALQRRTGIQCHDIAVDRHTTSVPDLLLRRFPSGDPLPRPDLLVAAGHRTHLSLLAARRAHGGRAVVLMRPTLPLGLFDLCLVPEHDNPPQRPNVLATRGALNTLTAAGAHLRDRALILLGGPSKHYGWDEAALQQQLRRLLAESPEVRFTLTASRRTPPDFLGRLQTAGPGNCRIVPLEETGPGWVARELARNSAVWVTEDSVSMIYEAVTAGCRVGLLQVPLKRAGRVSHGVAQLLEDGWVTDFETWVGSRQLPAPPAGFNEADRCAARILERGWGAD